MPRIERITKTCPNCGKEFTKPPSLARVVCCSRECRLERDRKFRKPKTCPVCGSGFVPPAGSNRVYCSDECKARSSVKVGPKFGPRIKKTCPVCGQDFEVTPSSDYLKTCSAECGYKFRASGPRSFSPEGYANLTGRPKKSSDVERTCPTCEATFTVPSWNPKVYCSRPCEFASRSGRPKRPTKQQEKTCLNCGDKFLVWPSQDYQECCSRSCAVSFGMARAAEAVRTMADVEVAWFAGLFDGEGSVVMKHRARARGSVYISITNTVLPLLEKVRTFTGVGRIEFKPVSEKNPKHADCYTWICGGTQAREILRQVRPWLIVKAERADAVLEGRIFPRQSRWDDLYPESPPR